MILDKTLILTLQDFRRHFDFGQFWAKRHNFVRDMSPDNVLYSSEDEKKLYSIICDWIDKEDNGVFSTREAGLKALSDLSGKTIDRREFSAVLVSIDCSKDIIYIPSGKTVNLSGNLVGEECAPSNNERIHKFEVSGENGDARILIGGEFACDLKIADFVYITEIDGRFMRILPNHLERGATILHLSNVSGQFGSTLEITSYMMGKHTENVSNVTQIAFDGAKVLYATDNHLIIK